MRGAKSIVLALSVPATGALADTLAPCPSPQISYTCANDQPHLVVNRSARSQDLDIKLGSASENSALGNLLMTLPAGMATLETPLQSLTNTPQELILIGQGKGESDACCVSTFHLAPPPENLCNETSQTPNVEPPKTPDETALDEQSFDIAITLEMVPDCPEGPAKHQCSGALTLDVTGTPDGIIPITIETDPNKGIETQLSGPLDCYDGGPGILFCRSDAAIIGQGLSLPITLSAEWSYQAHNVEICVGLTAPETPAAQIKLVQTALAALGYDAGGADGSDGPRTRAAVAELTARFGLAIDDPLDPDLHALLGLGAYLDERAENNQSCASTFLPARPKPRPKTDGIPRKKAGSGDNTETIIDTPFPTICDPLSTVKRGEQCVCRYEGMIRLTQSICLCRNGLPPSGAQGCG